MEQRLPASDKRRLVLLTGARQTGKTTLARHRYADIRYINLDAPENRETVRGAASALWARDIGPAVLDEAQKEPLVFDKVKYAYDDGAAVWSSMGVESSSASRSLRYGPSPPTASLVKGKTGTACLQNTVWWLSILRRAGVQIPRFFRRTC